MVAIISAEPDDLQNAREYRDRKRNHVTPAEPSCLPAVPACNPQGEKASVLKQQYARRLVEVRGSCVSPGATCSASVSRTDPAPAFSSSARLDHTQGLVFLRGA